MKDMSIKIILARRNIVYLMPSRRLSVSYTKTFATDYNNNKREKISTNFKRKN